MREPQASKGHNFEKEVFQRKAWRKEIDFFCLLSGCQGYCRKGTLPCVKTFVEKWDKHGVQARAAEEFQSATTLMAESKEELKSLWIKVKEESEKAGLKLNIKKTKIMASSPISSVQLSCSVVSNSLRPHEPQHARPPCPSPTPRVHPNPGPLSQWCHPTISSSVVPFSSCPQFFPASGSFPMSQLFTSGGRSIGVSASGSPSNTQDWSPLGWTGWISLQSKGLSRVFSNTTVQKHQFFCTQLSLESKFHIHTWPQEKP